MNRLPDFPAALKLAMLSAVLWAIYVAGVELGKRQTHTKIAKAVKQYFWPPEETRIPVVWSSSPIGYDPFGGNDFSGNDPFASDDPFGAFGGNHPIRASDDPVAASPEP